MIRCFMKYCRGEPTQKINGRWVCDREDHIGAAFVAIAEQGE